MMILEITGYTWLVTGLGFGMVLLLLFCFIYVMKLLGWIMQRCGQTVSKPETAAPQAAHKEATDDNDLAAVAITLHLYYNSLHDEESPRLTIKNHTTAWHIIQ